MDKVTLFLNTEDKQAAEVMWDSMFLNIEIAVALMTQPAAVVPLINKALGITPQWSTTRCAVAVEKLTSIAWAASKKKYNESFLYSLALAVEADPGVEFKLSDKQAEVSFHLCKLWRRLE